jgi:hypothetical protein
VLKNYDTKNETFNYKTRVSSTYEYWGPNVMESALVAGKIPVMATVANTSTSIANTPRSFVAVVGLRELHFAFDQGWPAILKAFDHLNGLWT